MTGNDSAAAARAAGTSAAKGAISTSMRSRDSAARYEPSSSAELSGTHVAQPVTASSATASSGPSGNANATRLPLPNPAAQRRPIVVSSACTNA